ncbi:MAG: FixH family protein [Sulfurimonas sp.]|nr:FixH family protein [Sulfurimonas sp.]
MSKSKGMIWPYAIGLSITLVFGACVSTIIITNKMPVEDSDTYMMGYHEADAKANELLQSKIDFDKRYKVEYLKDGINLENTLIRYRVTTLQGKEVDDAKIEIVVTRPNNHKHDKTLNSPKYKDGIYSFSSIKLPVEGRWEIMAKIIIGENSRYYNIKTDTRTKEAFEY